MTSNNHHFDYENNKTIEFTDTDLNGNFVINYESKYSSFCLKARHNFINTVIIKDIPTKKQLHFERLHTSIIYNLYIRLIVNNPYTSNDTIKLDIEGALQPVHIEIPGPFTSGIVDSIMNQTLSNLPYRYDEKPHINYRFSFSRFPKIHMAKKNIYSCSNNELIFTID